MKNWWIFTLLYGVLTTGLYLKAKDNMFGPDREGVLLIAAIIYCVLFVMFIAVRKFRSMGKNL